MNIMLVKILKLTYVFIHVLNGPINMNTIWLVLRSMKNTTTRLYKNLCFGLIVNFVIL